MFKPMLAAQCKDTRSLRYPVLATPKIDGIRCLIRNGIPVSRSLKPIPNKHIRDCLTTPTKLFEGFDGELTVGDTFQMSTSGIMSHDGTPKFTYWVFDLHDSTQETYEFRMSQLEIYAKSQGFRDYDTYDFIKILLPTKIHNPEELRAYSNEMLLRGHEGIMVRDPRGLYKHGRSTLNEGWLLKIKPFEDDEATIVGFEELMHNDNDPEVNALGYQERNTHRSGMIPGDTLGALVVTHGRYGMFNIGTGFSAIMRKQIWNDLDKYMDRRVKFRYQKIGTLNKPRCPVFLGFRDPDDM